MKSAQNDSIFDEALKIVSINKSKANALRLTLLKSLNNGNDIILRIRQYLGEFEYDLKTLYNIIKDLKLLFFDNEQNNFNNSINIEEEQITNSSYRNKSNNNKINNLKKNNSFNLINRYKKQLYLNNLDKILNISGSSKKKDKNSYSLTINICDNRNYNSEPKKEKEKRIYKSNSCKSLKNKDNYNKYGFLNNDKNNKKIQNSNRSIDTSYRNYLNNLNIEDCEKISNSFTNRKLNNHYKNYTYETDYSSNRIKDKNASNHNHNLLNMNINKDKISLKNLNNIYDRYSSLLNNYKCIGNNKNNINQNNNDNNLENEINNILTFRNPKKFQNYKNNVIPRLDLGKIEDNKSNGYETPFINYNNNYEIPHMNNKIPYYNEESNGLAKENSNFDIRNNNNNDYNYTYILNNDDINMNKNYLESNINSKRYEININLNDNNKINQNEDDILDENKKNEIIENVISLVLQDSNKLNHLQTYFGDDIGEKLLKREISQETLIQIVEILKIYRKQNKSEKNLFRGSKKNYNIFRSKRYSDNMILKECLNNNSHLNKDYPLGLLSMNDYFNN